MINKRWAIVSVTAALVTLLPSVAFATNPTHLSYNGGTLLSHPRVFVDFWCFTPNDPAQAAPVVTGLLSHIGNSKYLGTTELYAPGGSNIPTADVQPIQTWADPTCWPADNPPRDRHPNNADITNAIARAVTQFGATGDNDVIVFFTSYNRTFFPPGSCAYHSDRLVSGIPKSRAYIDIPYPADVLIPPRWPNGVCDSLSVGGTLTPSDITSVVTYHELAEAITDPRPTTQYGWFDTINNQEIGDGDYRVYWRNYLLDESHMYPLQPLWDITANGYASNFVWANKFVWDFGLPSPSNPVISTYWNDSGTVAGLWVTAGSVYHVGGYQPGWLTRPAAAYETAKAVDTFVNAAGSIVMQQEGGSGTTVNLGYPYGWPFAYSPGAASYGWSREDVFATGLQGGSCGPPYTTCSAIWHRGKDAGGSWGATWDQLPFVPAGVSSGVGVVSDAPDSLFVGVIDSNGHLAINASIGHVEPIFSGWFDAGTPGTAILGDPVLTANNPQQISAWVADLNGDLWEWHGTPFPPGTWINHSHPRSVPVTPNVAAVSNGDQDVYIEAVGRDGETYRAGYQSGMAFSWNNVPISTSALYKAATCH